MATEKQRFNPGENAPRSGRYRDTSHGSVVEMEEGEHLPPIPGGGEWEFIGPKEGGM